MSTPAGTVLALRALGLGDALTGVPALRGLRRAFPRARLVLAGPATLSTWLRDLGVVDAVLPTEGLTALAWTGPPPDVAVNLHGRGPQSHNLLRALRPGRLIAFRPPEASPADGPPWPENDHEVERWCALARWAGGWCDAEDLRLPPLPRAPHVVVHPGAASPSRRWAAERWAAVVAALAADGHDVVVTGTPSEAELCAQVAAADPRAVDGCGRYDVAALAQLVGSAALALCGDTGVAHLATAYGTPSVLLFGPTPARTWGPLVDPQLHKVLWHPRPGDPPGDPHGATTDVRLARTTVSEVLAAASELLASLLDPVVSRPRAPLP
ncbi:glycosyltransferase family 9 protein [Pedococcus sp. 5OH_020]|uniref:glycosyltransferase family 9 protein n=1 Tax=Pedococcus sp. 5OH_020 TaxID=2989814 RepID=UPI0022E9CBED|nr:glycosyltransferase family 9 protein [Pedococcus sp. 5OH_020]